VADILPAHVLAMNRMDRAAWMMGKQAAAGESITYSLTGLFYVTTVNGKHWGLLSAPAALVRGLLDAMHEPGMTPLVHKGRLLSHIVVMSPSEIEAVGGPDRLKADRGKPFRYTIGRLVSFEPAWPGVSRCWALRIHSPELQQLRRTYGLSGLPDGGRGEFRILVGIRKRGVTGRNAISKVQI